MSILSKIPAPRPPPLYHNFCEGKTNQLAYQVMEYVDTKDTDFKLLYKKLTPFDLRRYMYEALKILDFTHSRGVMHRDIKPHNLLYDITKGILKLIDWGLAEFYHPAREYHTKVAARFYKAPELLLDNPKYDYAVDVWALGCIFAAVMFQQEVFFQGKDDIDQLVAIAKVVGTDEIYDYAAAHGLKVSATMHEQLGKHPKKPWMKFKTSYNEPYVSEEAISLLAKMLVVDHGKRITAKDALAHPYFKDMA